MTQSVVSLEYIKNFVLEKVALRTKTPIDQLSENTDLASVGVDSLNAVLICGNLEDEFELEIEPIVMFKYKTAKQVAEAVLDMLTEK